MPGSQAATPFQPPARRRAAVVYLLFTYLNYALLILQGILLVPFYLRCIPSVQYGGWLATGNVLTMIELVDLGLSGVMQQRIADYHGRGDRGALARVIGTGLALNFALSLLPLLAWPAARWLGGTIHLAGVDRDTLAWSLRLGLISSVLTLAAMGLGGVVLGLQKSLAAGLIHTVASVSGVAATVVLLHLGVGLPALPIGVIVRSSVSVVGVGAVVAHWMLRDLHAAPTLDRRELRAVFNTSLYTFVSRLGSTLLSRTDAFLSAYLIAPGAATVITLNGRALDPIRMVAGSVGGALLPGLAHLVGEGRQRRAHEIIHEVSRTLAWLTAAGVGCVVALNAVFMHVWQPLQYGSRALTATLATSAALSIFVAVLTQFVFALGGIRQTAGATLAEATLKLPLQVGLVRLFGLPGMPLAAGMASLLVTGWYLPAVIARLTGQDRRESLRAWASNLAIVGGYVGAGMGVSTVLAAFHRQWNFADFLVATAVVGSAFGGVAIASDTGLRSRALGIARRFSRAKA